MLACSNRRFALKPFAAGGKIKVLSAWRLSLASFSPAAAAAAAAARNSPRKAHGIAGNKPRRKEATILDDQGPMFLSLWEQSRNHVNLLGSIREKSKNENVHIRYE